MPIKMGFRVKQEISKDAPKKTRTNKPNVHVFKKIYYNHIGETCPACGRGVFKARRNESTGELFLGCSNYPRCRNTGRLSRAGREEFEAGERYNQSDRGQ